MWTKPAAVFGYPTQPRACLNRGTITAVFRDPGETRRFHFPFLLLRIGGDSNVGPLCCVIRTKLALGFRNIWRAALRGVILRTRGFYFPLTDSGVPSFATTLTRQPQNDVAILSASRLPAPPWILPARAPRQPRKGPQRAQKPRQLREGKHLTIVQVAILEQAPGVARLVAGHTDRRRAPTPL